MIIISILFLGYLSTTIALSDIIPPLPTSINNAQFISQSIPTIINAGQTYQVSVTIKNTGTTTWNKESLYRLGSQNPANNAIWGNAIYYSPSWPEISRIELASGEQVLPGATKIFSFNIKAPSSSGNYNFQWKMVKDGVEWFGDLTPNIEITVNGAPPTAGKISIRQVNGIPEFYKQVIGSKFIPRGNNYARLTTGLANRTYPWHSNFDPGLYDHTRSEAALIKMKADGYNTLRVFLSYTGLQQNQTQPGLDATYMNNFKDFLVLAKNNDMKVIITASLPRNYKPIADQVPYPSNMPYAIGNPNIQFLHQGTINAYKQFWKDLINNIKGTDQALIGTIFAYDIWNEPFFSYNDPPFSVGSGTITVAEGGTYNISDAQQMTNMEDNSIAYFANQIYDAIKLVDPETLIGMSVCCPNSHYARLLAVNRSKVDYLDIHLYPAYGSTSIERLNGYLAAAEIEKRDKSKPIIAGEYGSNYQLYPTSAAATAVAVEMQTATCNKGFSGWMLWTWDTAINEQPSSDTFSFWSALMENEALNKVLAPIYRPDPCSTTTLTPTPTPTFTPTPTPSPTSTPTPTPTPTPILSPTVNLLVNNSHGPISIVYNTSANLSWTSINATSCTASGAWSGSKSTSGSISTGNLISSKTYTMTCTGTGASTSDSVTINLSSALNPTPTPISTPTPTSTPLPSITPTPTPSVTPTPSISPNAPTVFMTASKYSISSGETVAIIWSSVNVSYCTASGNWSGVKETSGLVSINPTQTSTYALTCSGLRGSHSQSLIVKVDEPSAVVINPISTPAPFTTPTPTPVIIPTLPTNPTQADYQSLLNALLKQLAYLQGQSTTQQNITSYQFTHNIQLGDSGEDVTQLQTFLKSQGIDIYPEGLVSGYFGNLTRLAIQRFQKKYGIISFGNEWTTGYGMVGPKTRLKLNELW